MPENVLLCTVDDANPEPCGQDHYSTISSQAKDLITRLLKASQEERISADEILKHPWLQVWSESI